MSLLRGRRLGGLGGLGAARVVLNGDHDEESSESEEEMFQSKYAVIPTKSNTGDEDMYAEEEEDLEQGSSLLEILGESKPPPSIIANSVESQRSSKSPGFKDVTVSTFIFAGGNLLYFSICKIFYF